MDASSISNRGLYQVVFRENGHQGEFSPWISRIGRRNAREAMPMGETSGFVDDHQHVARVLPAETLLGDRAAGHRLADRHLPGPERTAQDLGLEPRGVVAAGGQKRRQGLPAWQAAGVRDARNAVRQSSTGGTPGSAAAAVPGRQAGATRPTRATNASAFPAMILAFLNQAPT
jgi:hypothetical protein